MGLLARIESKTKASRSNQMEKCQRQARTVSNLESFPSFSFSGSCSARFCMFSGAPSPIFLCLIRTGLNCWLNKDTPWHLQAASSVRHIILKRCRGRRLCLYVPATSVYAENSFFSGERKESREVGGGLRIRTWRVCCPKFPWELPEISYRGRANKYLYLDSFW